MPAGNHAQFNKDEKALCFHHELLYEAKVLDVRLTDPNDKKSPHQYKIHYKGWKNTWDDWVPQDRLRKFTDENKELAVNLKKEASDSTRDRAGGSNGAPGISGGGGVGGVGGPLQKKKQQQQRVSGSGSVSGGHKRGRDSEIEREDIFHSRPSVRIAIPDKLKSILVDDWENVTKNLQLACVPSKTSALSILDDYAAFEGPQRRPGSADADVLEEVIQGLKDYFNRSLGRMLLYRFERQQFFEIYNGIEAATAPLAGKQIAEVYGGEHLLRLFVSLPELIAQTNMDQQSVSRLREELSKLTLWLAREAQVEKYFSTPYENASHDYIDKAKGSE